MSEYFNPTNLIEEVKSRPGLYKSDHPADREEKLALWKEVGAAIYSDWETYNKATAYDKVLQLQRKWRSLRDAYNRELRVRKAGSRRRKVYKYFVSMSFLKGFEGSLSEDDNPNLNESQSVSNAEDNIPEDLPLRQAPIPKAKKPRRKSRKRRSTSDSIPPPEEMEMPVFPLEIANDTDNDSDRLFMLSFLPEMRQLPSNIKMWVRAQIANVMQEAVTAHYSNVQPGAGASGDKNRMDVKRQRYDSTD